ncbi:MAG: succinate dehydrogenase, hydrophobic membrane anchor protein [Pseudomonadota bacterium]
MSYKTPKAMSAGLGSAGSGTHHWWQHRVSSIALIPLTILAILPFAQSLGSSHTDVLATYANPFHAIIAVLWLAVTFHHSMQGLQVVIEDYVHHKGWRTALLLGNQMFCGLFGFAGIFAILKIAFTS